MTPEQEAEIIERRHKISERAEKIGQPMYHHGLLTAVLNALSPGTPAWDVHGGDYTSCLWWITVANYYITGWEQGARHEQSQPGKTQ